MTNHQNIYNYLLDQMIKNDIKLVNNKYLNLCAHAMCHASHVKKNDVKNQINSNNLNSK